LVTSAKSYLDSAPQVAPLAPIHSHWRVTRSWGKKRDWVARMERRQGSYPEGVMKV
jgi:hypothetical protein